MPHQTLFAGQQGAVVLGIHGMMLGTGLLQWAVSCGMWGMPWCRENALQIAILNYLSVFVMARLLRLTAWWMKVRPLLP